MVSEGTRRVSHWGMCMCVCTHCARMCMAAAISRFGCRRASSEYASSRAALSTESAFPQTYSHCRKHFKCADAIVLFRLNHQPTCEEGTSWLTVLALAIQTTASRAHTDGGRLAAARRSSLVSSLATAPAVPVGW